MIAESLSVEMPITKSDYQSLTLRIKELEERIAELEKENAEQAKLITEQAKLIEELKARLAKYENPHTPPSAQRFKENSKSKKSKKRGAPNGHRGATRPTPEPDRVVEVTAEQSDHCGSTNLEECGVEKQVIEDIPPPPKIEVIQFNRHKYKCQDCEREFTAKDEECPQKGRFGVNLLVYLIMLKFSLRGVLRRIKDFAFHLNGAGVVDGWRAYNIIPVLQRCWAHLIREVDAFIEKPGGKELSEAIHEKFKALKEFLGKVPPASMEERKQQKEVWDREMADSEAF